MQRIEKAGLVARLAESGQDVAAALALRGRAFRGGGDDRDAQDALSVHMLIEDGDQVLATFRMRRYAAGLGLGTGYAGARYDLSRLARRDGVFAEMGRFCTAPGARDPDVIRLAWAAATRLIGAWEVGFLFGCASFAGTDPGREAAALGLLAARYLAPADWAPGIAAAETFAIAALPPPEDAAASAARLPPLLRSYLAMGGRVSDHAVIDRDLGTFHLFTGLDLAAVPPARAAALRDLAR